MRQWDGGRDGIVALLKGERHSMKVGFLHAESQVIRQGFGVVWHDFWRCVENRSDCMHTDSVANALPVRPVLSLPVGFLA